jgi:hypothetical protein
MLFVGERCKQILTNWISCSSLKRCVGRVDVDFRHLYYVNHLFDLLVRKNVGSYHHVCAKEK